MPATVLICLHLSSHLIVSTILCIRHSLQCPVLQMRTLRHKEVTRLHQGSSSGSLLEQSLPSTERTPEHCMGLNWAGLPALAREKPGFQFYSCKEMGSANSLQELGCRFLPTELPYENTAQPATDGNQSCALCTQFSSHCVNREFSVGTSSR